MPEKVMEMITGPCTQINSQTQKRSLCENEKFKVRKTFIKTPFKVLRAVVKRRLGGQFNLPSSFIFNDAYLPLFVFSFKAGPCY